ncbi:redoxin domain-containing protein [Roseovarius nitratireducens]|uniref:redoxin domain-containing protein n=1 Tax=Roseovarius nitratireducens TaxID=2044597 RepID=UPI0013ECD765|nr:redoxin domain-containing protein [Roseovarius nitratireducens]
MTLIDNPETIQPTSISEVFQRVANHDFHPVSEKSFTKDRRLLTDGIADLADDDWRVRLLAVRDLVIAGPDALEDITRGLDAEAIHVRYVAATALGIIGDDAAADALERTARDDPDALARSAATMALGQIGRSDSLKVLRHIEEQDPSQDVRHQAELAMDQIEKSMGSTEQLREAFRSLDPASFGRVRPGEAAPDFELPNTEGARWHLDETLDGEHWIVLVWVFADWCPVCHREFAELIELRKEFSETNVRVATLEAHDTYRSRVMVGKELDPKYWFAEESFQEAYVDNIWWPHLMDRAGAVGARYGIDPMAYAVHAEYINRPATIIIGPDGIVRLAWFGTYWGDRPSMSDVLGMIRSGEFEFNHANASE